MTPEIWKEAERLFLACADRPTAVRDEFLNIECKNQPELRRAVEDLLRGDASEDPGVQEAIGRAAADMSEKREDRRINSKIGAYHIDRRIAEGGMGVVYLAHRSDRQFDQQVAIKILATSIATEELRARFLSERQILANLNHANIAQLLDGGQTEEGMPYLVMEYIDGVPIDEYCDAENLPVADRLELFAKVCSAVDAAHKNLVIHRDIKPSNILVSADGVPKLLDFGIAKLLDLSNMPHNVTATIEGTRLLTPRHASPEQVLGQHVTTASDVYSLGLLLYELLCGSFPYEITNATRASEIEETVTRYDPPPPSLRIVDGPGANRIRKSLRGDLDTIVMTALRKEPDARYPSASALAEDLRRFVAHKPINARPPTRAYLISRYWLRHRTVVIGVAATVLAIFIGTTAATLGFLQAREAERAAVTEAQSAAAISNFLVSLFQEGNPDTSAGNERSVRELLGIGLERANTELQDSPAVKVRVLETLSSVYKSLSDNAQAQTLLEQAIALLNDQLPDDVETRARLLNDLGDLERIQSHRENAAALIEKSIGLYHALGSPLTDDHADAVNNLALTYQEMGRVEAAQPLFEDALQMRQALYESPHEKIALSLHNLGWHYGRTTDLDLAVQYTLEAIAMRTEVYGEIHPRVAATTSMLSRFYQRQNKWDDAEAAARKSVAIAEQIFDDGHPDLTFPLYELAAVLNDKGDLAEARRLLEQIVDWERISLGPDSHDFGMSLKAYGETLVDLAEYEEAEAILRESQHIFARLPGSIRGLNSADTLLGRLLIRTGQSDAAAEPLGMNDEIPLLLEDDAASLDRHMEIVEVFLSRGQLSSAEDLIEGLLELFDSPSSGNAYEFPQFLALSGKVSMALGRSNEAIDLTNQAIQIYADRGQHSHWRVSMLRMQLGQALLDNSQADAGTAQLEQAHGELVQIFGPEHPEARQTADILNSILKSK